MKISSIMPAFAMTACIAGCSSPPAAEVSKSEMQAIRTAHDQTRPGMPKDAVLQGYKAGNTLKLGSSLIDGVTIEEWKAEAFRDEKNRKDMLVTFLYFCNDQFVDQSDSRIDFRNNPELVDRWKASLLK